jgi:hypothetical protein
MQPTDTALNELLLSRFQLILKQIEIIYGTDAQNALARGTRADAVHERTARGTEVVSHGVARGDGAALTVGFQVVAATEVLEVRVLDGEVGGEHGGSEFVAVEAVADEGID